MDPLHKLRCRGGLCHHRSANNQVCLSGMQTHLTLGRNQFKRHASEKSCLFFLGRGEFMFFEAIFEPSQPKEYNSDARSLVGKRIPLMDGWIIQDGPFKGQHCYYIPNTRIGWIPASDLKEIKPVSKVTWTDIHKSLGFLTE